MSNLHIVQGGIANGDLEWIRVAAASDKSGPWVVPKSAQVGDEVVVYVTGYGFIATATISSATKIRTDWQNRYGSRLTGVRLIHPPVPLETIRASIPEFNWARYPRSITTPTESIAARVRSLIEARRNQNEAARYRDADEDIKEAARQLSLVDVTTREALVLARRGQGIFRQRLLEYWQACALSGCAILPALRASHIKPWRDSSNDERLDLYNGLLLLGTADLLFDAGLISFSDKGMLLMSAALPPVERKRLDLREGLRLRRVKREHAFYLKWHRERVFVATG